MLTGVALLAVGACGGPSSAVQDYCGALEDADFRAAYAVSLDEDDPVEQELDDSMGRLIVWSQWANGGSGTWPFINRGETRESYIAEARETVSEGWDICAREIPEFPSKTSSEYEWSVSVLEDAAARHYDSGENNPD